MSLFEQKWRSIWFPCSQMKDYETFPPLPIKSAKGSYLYLQDDRVLIDAISSWWCKSLGHGHPRLKQALLRQLEKFEHVILANTVHESIVDLSYKLSKLTHNLNKIFYASDGSCAVEIAMKMSLHAHLLQGQTQRNKFMTLQNSYHGETCAALSVSDVGLYRNPYQAILFEPIIIEHIPYVSHKEDPLWFDIHEIWPKIETQLEFHKNSVAAILVEPIVQGACGMKIYSQDFLRRLRKWSKENNIHLIADEIMTGLGRTGLALACQHAAIEPDFLCLSKGLTSGWLPLSAVCTSQSIYDLFYDDYATGKAFLHSHTYSGNALAVSVALECLKILEEENIYHQVQQMEKVMANLMHEIADDTKKINNIRYLGGIIAADLVVNDTKVRAGYQVYREAVELGALLRPIGNTIYWLPPLNTEIETLHKLQKITAEAITKAFES